MSRPRPSKRQRRWDNAIRRMVSDDEIRAVLVEMFSEFSGTIRTSEPTLHRIHEGKRELALWFIAQCHHAGRDCGLRMLAALTGGVETWPQELQRAPETQEQEPEELPGEES